jgi:cytochrome c
MKNQFRTHALLLVLIAIGCFNFLLKPNISSLNADFEIPLRSSLLLDKGGLWAKEDSEQYFEENTDAAVNQLTEAEEKAGWKRLFNGKDMTGWRNFNKQTIGKDWIIEDKAIHLNAQKNESGHWQAKDGGDIITTEEYENYELRLDWRIAPCGNSGIIYNVLEREDLKYVWHTGPEMQVLDDACHPDAKIHKHKAGDLYDLIPCASITVKPAGQWNKIRLIQRNGKVEHWQNGKKVVEYDQNAPTWKEMIAGSKFKSMPAFGTSRKGHIALQDHGDKVWYRNIKIRPL